MTEYRWLVEMTEYGFGGGQFPKWELGEECFAFGHYFLTMFGWYGRRPPKRILAARPTMKTRALKLAAGLWIAAGCACAQGILPANDGALDLGDTLVGVPVVRWYKVQQPLVSLTATTDNTVFGVALVADTGNGHGTLPAAEFAQSVTANCNNCWVGVQFYSQVVGAASSSLALTASGGAGTETVSLAAGAVADTGLVMTPLTQDFASVAVHSSSAPVTFTMANLLTSQAAVTVQSVSVSGDFVVVPNGSGGASCAVSLVPTGSCSVQVSFAPSANGERDGVLSVVTSGGTATVALTGNGTTDPGVALNPVALNFASVPGAAAQTVVITNTGAMTVTVGSVSASEPSFRVSSGCGVLLAGASCNVSVGFTPQSTTVLGTLTVPVRSGPTLTNYSVALNGGYTAQDAGLEVVAGEVEFGATATGALEASRLFTVNNLTAKDMTVAFAMPREFPLTPGVAPCATLEANGSCSFSASFLPVTGGPLTGTVVAQGTPTDGSAAVQGLAYLQGYGTPTGMLAITGYAIPNTPLGFGEVTSGQSVSHVLTLANSGGGTVTVRRITSEPPFLSTSTCGTALAAGARCTVTVTYAPVYVVSASDGGAPRTDTGTMSIESDAVSSPDAVAMTGIALPVVGTPTSPAVVSGFGLSEGALTFGNTQVGNVSAAQTVTLTNTGTTVVHVLSMVVSTDFGVSSTCGTVAAGASCAFSLTFAPTTATSAAVRSGTLEVLSDAGTSLEFVSLVGVSTPAALTLSPAALDFGTVNVGTRESLSVSVSNAGSVGVTFLGLTVSGDYTVNAGTCPAVGSVLGVGETCVLTVTFQPMATGTRSGTLSLSSDASQVPLTVALSGVGAEGTLTVTPGALAFGGVDVGFSEQLTVTLLNTGSAAVTGISGAIGGVNAGDFAVTVPCSVTTLAPRQSCAETVTFTPAAVGARAATLSVASSDPNGAAVVALGGTGLEGGSFVLTVDGGSSASETVASGSPGSYALLLTPSGGFSGNVALTCSPLTAGADLSCSLLAPTLTVGGAAVSSTATISTIASDGGAAVGLLAGLFVLPLGWRRRRGVLLGMAVMAGCGWLVGCGGGGAGVTSNVRTTPAGTYQYRVTASSTGGAVVSSSVTLTLVVQ
jgi:hypothetical protein